MTLSWNAATDNVGVARYQVFRRKGSTGSFTQVGTTTGRTFTSGSLARRTTYWFKVRAVDTSGNIGLLSPGVSARTL